MQKSNLLENLNSRKHNLLIWLLALVLPFSVFAFSGMTPKQTNAEYAIETLTLDKDSTKLSDTELTNFSAKTSDDTDWATFSGHAINVSTTDGKATLPIHVYNGSGATWKTSTSAWVVGEGATSSCVTLFIGVFSVSLESLTLKTTTAGITGTTTNDFELQVSTGTNSIDESHAPTGGYASGLISNGFTTVNTPDTSTTDTTRTMTHNFVPLSGYTWLWIYLAKTTGSLSIDSLSMTFSVGTSQKSTDYATGYYPLLKGNTIGETTTTAANFKGCYLLAAESVDTTGKPALCFLSSPYKSTAYSVKYVSIKDSSDPWKLTGLQIHDLAGCFFIISPDAETSPTGYYITSASTMLNMAKPMTTLVPQDTTTNALFKIAIPDTTETYQPFQISPTGEASNQIVYDHNAQAFDLNAPDETFYHSLHAYYFDFSSAARACAYAFSAAFAAYLSTSTETNLVDIYKSLPVTERHLFGDASESTTFTASPASAMMTLLYSAKTNYLSLFDDKTVAFKAAEPVVSYDYENGRYIGFYADETYAITTKTASEATASTANYTASIHDDGSVGFPFAFTSNSTVVFDSTYYSIAIAVYDSDSNYTSRAVPLTIKTYLTAPTTLSSSAVTTVVAPAVGSDAEASVEKVFNDSMELSVSDTASGNALEYALVPSTTTYDDAWKSNTFSTWNSTSTFSKDNLNGSTAFAEATSYDLYARYAAVYTGTELTSMPTAPVKLASYTTLAAAEGGYRHAMVKSYSIYQDTLTANSTLSVHTAVDQICQDFYKALSSSSDASTYYANYCGSGSDYTNMTTVYNDSVIKQKDLDTMADDLSNQENSTAINSLIGEATTGISGYGIAELAMPSTINSAFAIYQTKLAGARYLVDQKKALITYFNDTILPQMTSFTNANRDTMWSTLTTGIANIAGITLDPTSLDTTKGKADEAYTTAKTNLDNQVISLAGSKA